MSDNAYFLHASAQAKKIISRLSGFTPKERGGRIPPLPQFFNELVSTINIEENIQSSDGPTKIIDVQPDFRNVFLTINYHITRYYANLDQKTNPDLTPVSMMAYCLTIVYGLALINDDENIRQIKSQHSDEFTSDAKRQLLRDQIARMSVPPFMEPILEGLNSTTSTTRSKLRYVYTLAAFHLEYDYGRIFPVSMYLKAHDIIASSAPNRLPNDTQWQWLNSDVISAPVRLKIGQLLGVNFPNANFPNWFASANFTLFNPVTARTNTTRSTFKRIPVTPYQGPATVENINPYIYVLNASSQNVIPMTNFVKTMSDAFTREFTGSKPLGTYAQMTDGRQIISHYYLPPTLPTYHFGEIEMTEAIQTDVEFQRAIHDYAKFPDNPENNIPFPDPEPEMFIRYLYLANPEEIILDPDTRVIYDSSLHQLPEVRHFLPQDMNSEFIYFNTLTGKSIETAEIAGFSVPLPNPNQPLRVENGHFLDSALPLRLIKKHTAFTGAAENTISFVERQTFRSTHPIMHFDLYDRGITRMTYYDQNIHNGPDLLAYTGYTPTNGVSSIARSSTVHSFKIKKTENATTSTVPAESYYAWSSYRHINLELPFGSTSSDKILMILNFRTLYGTNSTMSQTTHPAELIPSA